MSSDLQLQPDPEHQKTSWQRGELEGLQGLIQQEGWELLPVEWPDKQGGVISKRGTTLTGLVERMMMIMMPVLERKTMSGLISRMALAMMMMMIRRRTMSGLISMEMIVRKRGRRRTERKKRRRRRRWEVWQLRVCSRTGSLQQKSS
jgi:hypothetical protein